MVGAAACAGDDRARGCFAQARAELRRGVAIALELRAHHGARLGRLAEHARARGIGDGAIHSGELSSATKS